MIFTVLGLASFVYLHIGNSENAVAGNGGAKESMTQGDGDTQFRHQPANADIDFSSYMSSDELQLLINRNFEHDTIRKEYTSVKWNVNTSFSHITLEVTNNKHEYSLEVFDQN